MLSEISEQHHFDEEGRPAGGVTTGRGLSIEWQNGPDRGSSTGVEARLRRDGEGGAAMSRRWIALAIFMGVGQFGGR